MKFFIKYLFCGFLTSFLFPPFFLFPLGFLIFPFLFYLLIDKKFKSLGYIHHFVSGLFYGIGFFSILLIWVNEPFFLEESTRKYFLFSYLLIIYCSLYFGMIFCIIKFFNTNFIKLLIIPSTIVLGEFLCANLLYGFPWFSFSLVNSANVLGTTLIFYIGTYGLSYITITIYLLPAIFLINNKFFFNLLFRLYLILFLIILTTIYIRNHLQDNKSDNFANISISQLNQPANIIDNHQDAQKKAQNIISEIIQDKSDFIIFAENDYPYLMDNYNIKLIQKLLKKNQSVIIGSTRKEESSYYNSLFLINKNEFKKFDKKTLVPFGEFIPFRKYLKFMEFVGGLQDFKQGSDDRILSISNNINIIPVICYEIIYFWSLLNKNSNGKNKLIVNITNDSWFGKISGPYQHFYFSKLRAAEFNIPLVRVSSNGISGYIDNYGNIINFLDLNKKQTKKINIRIPSISKNYLFFHKFFLIFIIMNILIGILFEIKKNER